ncbi:hypothetical protein SAMN05421690_104510 [Nitrosomonas sp. Nm51]|nr:hypothetical protein SAMN05421690_104510 [Nitrosomonas sp. Nm51]
MQRTVSCPDILRPAWRFGKCVKVENGVNLGVDSVGFKIIAFLAILELENGDFFE